MTDKTFIFDLDETLKYTRQDYFLAITQFFNIVYTHPVLRFTAPDIKSLIDKFDKENQIVLKTNRGKSSCPNALLKVYGNLCDKNKLVVEENIKNKILDIENVIFHEQNYKGSLIPGSKDVLEFLTSKKDSVYLLTRGNKKEQNKKIDVLEIRKYFKEVIVVPNNKHPVFKEFSEKVKDKNKTYSVGDSIDSDINPATKCGLKAIHIIQPSLGLNYDVHKIEHPEKVKKMDSVEEIIKKYEEL